MKIFYSILAASILFVSCGQYQKTKSGLVYKITHGNGTQKIKAGQFVVVNIEYKGGLKDSILLTTFGHIPAVYPVDTGERTKYSFMEILPLCKSGDKINFALSTDTLRKMGANLPDNPVFAPKSFIKGRIEILKVFSDQNEIQAYMEKQSEDEKQREIKDIASYLAKKNIKAQQTPQGVFVEIQTPVAGEKIDTGKQVSVFYKGTLLSNGNEFDSNIKNGVKQQPFNFVVGQHRVIPGWEEGLKYFTKGAKGKLYVPAMLAYGQQGNPVMPPYSNLIFEVEVVDVTTPAPASTQANPMPAAVPHGVPQQHQPTHK